MRKIQPLFQVGATLSTGLVRRMRDKM